jgi:quercetin dioxygenase-like cupin family protein
VKKGRTVNSYRLKDIEEREIVPGLTGRFIHSEHMTVAYWSFDPGVSLPRHSHEHEQIVNVLEGTFELTVGDAVHRLESGSVVIIPPDVPHSGRSVTQCKVIDVFHPVRDDFK